MADKYKNPRATKRYKELVAEFQAANVGKQVVTPEDLETVKAMRARAMENDLAREWLEAKGQVELSIVWDDPTWGIRCKGRLDKWIPDMGLIVDYKTTDWPPEFERSIWKYGYHVQAAFYLDGLKAATDIAGGLRFGIIAQEKNPPYSAVAAVFDSEAIMAGRVAYKNALEQVAKCSQSGTWPGPENPACWSLPEWARISSGPNVSFEGVE